MNIGASAKAVGRPQKRRAIGIKKEGMSCLETPSFCFYAMFSTLPNLSVSFKLNTQVSN